jgi:low affinity Fe/Cu permease
VGYLGRVERRKSSRVIDAISDLLGREATFATVVMCDVVALAVVVAVGIGDTPVVSAISLFVSLATLVMVCAVQHTSSRESKALNLKMDELIRVSEARNDLIGAEEDSHSQLATHAVELRERHRRQTDEAQ